MKIAKLAATVLAALAGIASGQGAGALDTANVLPRGSEKVNLDPATFTTRIDSPWWPCVLGAAGCIARPTPRGRGSALSSR